MSNPAAKSHPADSSGHPRPAFQEVYAELQPRIRHYMRRLVGAAEAEDLTQEVFIKVSQALPDFRGDGKVSTWVYRIATNAALDRLRDSSSRTGGPVPLQIGRLTERPPDATQLLARKEMSQCIRRYVDALPPSFRAVVLLSEEEGLSNLDIAETLGVTLETVKIRLHRARARLRKALGTGCSLYRDERNELGCEPRRGGVSPAG